MYSYKEEAFRRRSRKEPQEGTQSAEVYRPVAEKEGVPGVESWCEDLWWRAVVESLCGELVWRAVVESWYGELVWESLVLWVKSQSYATIINKATYNSRESFNKIPKLVKY